jgi:putative glutamine amidotransferase
VRPVVGITLELDDNLVQEVERGLREPVTRAGALAFSISRDTPAADIPALLDLVDGITLSGGADVHPLHYGEEQHPLTHTVPETHDAFEITLAREALRRGMPVLGICRGAQVLAVADGGALTQDVLTQHEGAHPHTGAWYDLALEPPGPHWHAVRVAPGSRVARWIGDGPARVNTFHHQCVRRTGELLLPTAWAEDGVIEAVERTDGAFAVGLQWHNEMMWRHDRRFLAPHHEFADAAWEYARRRRG